MTPFGERDREELASFLRGVLGARRVEIQPGPDTSRVRIALYDKHDQLESLLEFERACLERAELADLRGYLARPLVRRRIREAGPRGFAVPSAEIGAPPSRP